MCRAIALVALVWAALGSTLLSQPAGRRVVVAAASDLQTALPALAADFEKATGITPVLTFGSSGSVFAQIQNGAPFDVFLSADLEYPTRLVNAGVADRQSLYAYATGELVLWTRTDTGLDVRQGLTLLRDPRVRTVAIANPDLAPYGRAAVSALRARKLYDEVQRKLVFGDNISQTAQLAQSGNADAGLVSHSMALGPAMKSTGTFTVIPTSDYPPIVQAVVLVSTARNAGAGRALLRYLRGDAARRTFAAFGFAPPPR